jgi:hypothetical protein
MTMRAWSKHTGFAALSIAFSLGQLRLSNLVLQGDPGSVDVAHGIVTGLPPWRVFQSRVLGPVILEALSRLFPTRRAAYAFFAFAAVALCGYLLLALSPFGRNSHWRHRPAETAHDDPRPALLAFFCLQALVALLSGRPWLYAWDYLDLIFFVLFNVLALTNKPWPYLFALFIVSTFNRESAWFIAIWMMAQPLVEQIAARRRGEPARFDYPRFGAGAIALPLGVAMTEALRRWLLVREIGPEIYTLDPTIYRGPYFHFQLWSNLRSAEAMLTTLSQSTESIALLVLGATVVMAVVLALRDPQRWLALGVVHILMVGSLLLFGVLLESRIYLELVPFLALGTAALQCRDAEASRLRAIAPETLS